MNQIFMSEQEFSDYMDEKEKAVIKNATPEIRKQAIIETITELYDMKQISLENAANKLNLTVPEFKELLKQQRKSA